jgi:ribonuclease Y
MGTPQWIIVVCVSSILLCIVGLISGYFYRVKQHDKSLQMARDKVEGIIAEGKLASEKLKKETIYEAKQEIQDLKREAAKDIEERRTVVKELENKLTQREESLDRRSLNLDKREESLNVKESKLDDKKIELEQLNNKVDELLAQQQAKLVEIAGLNKEQAREIIMNQVKDSMSQEIALYIKEEEEKAKDEVVNRAKNILSLAIQKYASETCSEKTVNVVSLPADEMKGRIIGREGRNIRTIESLTGVDLIIDDTPEAVVLSGFDPIRRQIAQKSLETLIADGRIHPARIEEIVDRSRQEVEMYIREKGEEAVFKAQVGKVHPDLVKILGRLHYRSSYGQNVLQHSLETAFLASKLAAELGLNETLARRAGFFHDIGKAVDHEVEGSHVDIGVQLATKYREPKEVIDAIASHHGDKEPESMIAILVAAADAVSSSRPGARSDSLENYVKRLEALEQISNKVPGVETSFAIQAGREIRVMVKPDEVDDLSTFTVARKIKEEIEQKLSYPGTIKVTVIRETRAVDVAK